MKTSLHTTRTYSKGKIIAVFQPHIYTRTKALLDEFAELLKLSDVSILLDIYAAREKDNGTIHSKDLLNKMKEASANGFYAKSFGEVVDMINNIVTEGDTVIIMSAGNVNGIIGML